MSTPRSPFQPTRERLIEALCWLGPLSKKEAACILGVSPRTIQRASRGFPRVKWILHPPRKARVDHPLAPSFCALAVQATLRDGKPRSGVAIARRAGYGISAVYKALTFLGYVATKTGPNAQWRHKLSNDAQDSGCAESDNRLDQMP